MNYIKRLEAENRKLVENAFNAGQAILELRVYLESDKFQCGDNLDGYVHIKDVIARLNNITFALNDTK